MSDILAEICARTRADLVATKAARPLAEVEAAARSAPPVRGFAHGLARAAAAGLGLIAEIKRASPSHGLIRPDFDPPAIARAYQAAGAACLSVLTDRPYFAGEPAHLIEARAAVDLPVLRKDFMVDPYQVAEARAVGADCILIIMAAVEDGLARELAAAAADWSLDILIEVHDQAELDRALRLDGAMGRGMIGINNRNLKTLKTDLATTPALARQVPPGRLVVSESGLQSHADLARLAEGGVRAFLVGESLLRQPDPGAAARALLRGTP